MTTVEISIRELHARTGHFVRLAARNIKVIVTERGKPAAQLSPLVPPTETAPSAILGERRRLRDDYQAALAGGN